jgi:hypothetical protein
MKKRAIYVLVVASSVLCFASPAIAKPVTKAELVGKTICWNFANKETYSSDGKVTDDLWGNGTWAITARGFLQLRLEHWQGILDMEKQQDGSFRGKYTASGGGDYVLIINYCK